MSAKQAYLPLSCIDMLKRMDWKNYHRYIEGLNAHISPAVIHYYGNKKPWNRKFDGGYGNYFLFYAYKA